MSEPVEKSVLENANQISQFLEEQGYPCAYNTIASHIRKGTLVPRRGGGVAPGTALSWAKKYVQRRAIDVSPEADAPQEQTETGYVAEQSARIKLRIQEQDLEDKRFAAAKERGRYILAETWDAELGERDGARAGTGGLAGVFRRRAETGGARHHGFHSRAFFLFRPEVDGEG